MLPSTSPILPAHFFFYFRHNRYYLTTGLRDHYTNLPPSPTHTLLTDALQPVSVSWHHPVDALTASYRDWFWSPKTLVARPDGPSGSLTRVAEFASANEGEDVRVVCGAGGSLVSWVPGSALTWSEWPDAATCARMTPVVLGAKLEVVALGYENAYFIKKADGSCVWDLCGRYDVLERALERTEGRDVSFVALNPDVPGEFLLLLKKKVAVFCLPERMATEVTRRLESKGIACVVLGSSESGFKLPSEFEWKEALEYTHAVVAIGSKCTIM